MDNITDLKLVLKQVIDNNYIVPKTISTSDLVSKMLENIGDVDPFLRDDLIYSIFVRWIIDDYLDTSHIKETLDTLLDDKHLFYHIGENNTDSVFTRSFSVLFIALVVHSHRNHPIFDPEQIMEIFHSVTEYFKHEKDVRGYVKDKGWAHSMAHSADALDELILCNVLKSEDLNYVLELIKTKICIPHVFINEEDERLATVVTSIIDQSVLSSEEIIKWINSFRDIESCNNYLYDSKININRKNFIRSLYFRVFSKKEQESLLISLKSLLDETTKFK